MEIKSFTPTAGSEVGQSLLPQKTSRIDVPVQPAALSPDQIRKGLILAACFLALRMVNARLWNSWFGMEYHPTAPFLLFLSASFVVISVGLVGFGFTRWAGVDLKSWWLRPGRTGEDVAWGFGALVLGGILFLGVATGLYFLNLIPANLMAAPQEGETIDQTLSQIPVNLVLGWFFGFAIAAFTEETVFRGFLMRVLVGKTNPAIANLVQAAIFAASHLGMAQLGTLPYELFSLAFRFISGLLFGWLALKRGSLLPAGIVHGFIG